MKHHDASLSFRLRAGLGVLALLLVVPLVARTQEVVINELLTDNEAVYIPFPAQDGDYAPDYVELQNLTANAIDLGAGGWQLRSVDDAETNYVFKAGEIIPANGFLVVFLDDRTELPGIHTGFSVRASRGDTLALFSNNGGVTNRFGIQAEDWSVGRVPDGSGPFQLNFPSPGAANVAAPLGDVLKLRLNEWQALGSGSGRGTNDWIEIYNPETNVVAIGGLMLNDDPIPVPAGDAIRDLSFIGPQAFVQILLVDNANDADELEHFSLSSSGGDRIYMFAPGSSVAFDDVATSPVPTAQANETEGRVPDGGDLIIHFKNSTPGDSNFGPIPEVVFSELLTHTDLPLEDAIELLNVTNVAVDIGHWWISDNRNNPKKFRIPAGTILPPGGRVVFYEWAGVPGAPGFNTSGTGNSPDFTLNSAHGGSIYLFKGDANGNLTGFRRGNDFEASQNSVSFGRHVTSDGKADLVAMSSRSFGMDNPTTLAQFRTGTGAPNPYPLVGPVVVNEVHYHPPDDVVPGVSTNDNSQLEFVEIRNITSQPVLLYDPNIYQDETGIYADGRTNTLRLRGEVDFDFPPNVTLPPNGFALVVSFDPSTDQAQLAGFKAAFPDLADTVPLFGPYEGKLSNGGGAVELLKPDPPQSRLHPEDFGFVPYILMDRVDYNDTAPWPIGPDGAGESLQRVVSSDHGNDPANWRGAAPTPGRVNGSTSVTPPVITAQPVNRTVAAGSTVSFQVTAEGQLLAYRWLFNGAPMLSATNPILTLSNVSSTNAGTYRVRVSNPAGEVLSAPATLKVQATVVDTTRPTVAITAPLANAKLTEPMVILRGTASDRGGVTNVEYRLNSDPFLPATGTTSWQATLNLIPGTNVVEVRATDSAGNVSVTNTRKVFYVKTAPFVITRIGEGTIVGVTNGQPLEIGRRYTITAIPATGWLFSDWSGSLAGTAAKLTFTMEENFGLVASFIANPFIPARGIYNGLFYEPAGVQHHSSGFFSLNLTDRGAYTATMVSAGKRYVARGNFDLSGHAANAIPRPGASAIAVFWALALDGSDQITGLVSNETWTAELLGDRAVWNSRSNAFPNAGKYTLVIPGVTNLPGGTPSSPEGNGYGTATIDANGIVNFRGFLADGTPAAQRVALSKDGDWPLYISLYGGQGSLLGWATAMSQDTSDLSSARVSWTKPALGTAKYYPQGFVVESPLIGSRYVAPVGPSSRVLAMTNGIISFTGGNLAVDLVNTIILGLGSKVTNGGPNRLTLTFSPSTGLFAGSVTPTNATRAIPFKGAVLQKANNASGYFLGPSASGRVLLQGAP